MKFFEPQWWQGTPLVCLFGVSRTLFAEVLVLPGEVMITFECCASHVSDKYFRFHA